MIPVYFKTESFSAPASELYYLVAANGVFLVRKTDLFASTTEVRSLPGLVNQEESISLFFRRVPSEIMERVYGFFQTVWEKWEGEAVVFLYYALGDGSFHIVVPPQTLFRYNRFGRWRTEMRVQYHSVPRPDGLIKIGDAHSHADLPAFYSCADDRDDKEDGLRIIIGDLHRSKPDVSVSFVANGIRFIVKPEDVMEDFSTLLRPPEEWLKKVTCLEEDWNRGRMEEDGKQAHRHEKNYRKG